MQPTTKRKPEVVAPIEPPHKKQRVSKASRSLAEHPLDKGTGVLSDPAEPAQRYWLEQEGPMQRPTLGYVQPDEITASHDVYGKQNAAFTLGAKRRNDEAWFTQPLNAEGHEYPDIQRAFPDLDISKCTRAELYVRVVNEKQPRTTFSKA